MDGKRCPYDPCIRTPFAVRAPGTRPASGGEPVSNVDLAADDHGSRRRRAGTSPDGESLAASPRGADRGSHRRRSPDRPIADRVGGRQRGAAVARGEDPRLRLHREPRTAPWSSTTSAAAWARPIPTSSATSPPSPVRRDPSGGSNIAGQTGFSGERRRVDFRHRAAAPRPHPPTRVVAPTQSQAGRAPARVRRVPVGRGDRDRLVRVAPVRLERSGAGVRAAQGRPGQRRDGSWGLEPGDDRARGQPDQARGLHREGEPDLQ